MKFKFVLSQYYIDHMLNYYLTALFKQYFRNGWTLDIIVKSHQLNKASNLILVLLVLLVFWISLYFYYLFLLFYVLLVLYITILFFSVNSVLFFIYFLVSNFSAKTFFCKANISNFCLVSSFSSNVSILFYFKNVFKWTKMFLIVLVTNNNPGMAFPEYLVLFWCVLLFLPFLSLVIFIFMTVWYSAGISQSYISQWLLQQGLEMSDSKRRAFYRWYLLERNSPGELWFLCREMICQK